MLDRQTLIFREFYSFLCVPGFPCQGKLCATKWKCSEGYLQAGCYQLFAVGASQLGSLSSQLVGRERGRRGKMTTGSLPFIDVF